MKFEELQAFQQECIEKMEPFNEILKAAEAKHKEDIKPIEDAFYEKKVAFFDSVLKDSNGTSIQVDDELTHGKNRFKVTGRRLQVIFGMMLNNPAIYCHKYKDDGTLQKKEFSFQSRECSGFTILKK